MASVGIVVEAAEDASLDPTTTTTTVNRNSGERHGQENTVDVDLDAEQIIAICGANNGYKQSDESNETYGNNVDVPSADADAIEDVVVVDHDDDDAAAESSLLEIDHHDVSDISASSSDIDDVDEQYNVPVDFNDDAVMNNVDSLYRPSSLTSSRMIRPINNHDTTNFIRSKREYVDRLLMMTSGDGIIDGSNSFSSSTFHQSYTYPDRDYYKNPGEWLRFMQRRHAVHMAERYPETRARHPSDYYSSEGFVYGESPGNQPDQYHREYDNSCKQMGLAHQHYHPQQHRGLSPTMILPHGHHDSNYCVSLPIDDDEELQCEGTLHSDPTNFDSDLEEESKMPNNVHVVKDEGRYGEMRNCTDDYPQNTSQHLRQQDLETAHESKSSDPSEEGGLKQYVTTLREGGIIGPQSDPLESSSSIHRLNSDPSIPPRDHRRRRRRHEQQPKNAQEGQISAHEASRDSKYATYACSVDHSQDDRSMEIILFSLERPHMRSFHCAWVSFFFAFLAWFAISPLLAEVQISLELTKEQIWTSSICSVAGAVLTRCVAGLFCDIYGARWMTAVVLFVCGVPTMCTGFVNSAVGLNVLRLFTGIAGSAFVTCQYWTCSNFTKEVAGTANALAAGWGNVGGGVAQLFVGSMLFPFFKWIYAETAEPAELSWRTCCVIPGLFCIAFTFVILRYSDDSPKGSYHKRKALGLMQRPSAIRNFKAAARDHNTWLLLIQYGCCFGVELTTENAAALFFKEEFEMSTEAAAAVASIFGWMNLFARALGGFLSDISNAYRGMRGRLIAQLLCFLLEGLFVMIFSKARTLGGAITAMVTFSIFVQASEGSTFGIVPYLNPNVTGAVAGIIGAGGCAGAVIFSLGFRQLNYRDAFFWMGVIVSASSLLTSFVWIRGYEGLFFKKRKFADAKSQRSMTTS